MSRRRVMMMLFGSNISNILSELKLRATYYENEICTTATLIELENIQ